MKSNCNSNKLSILFACIFLFLFCFSLVISLLLFQQEQNQICIYANGELYGTYSTEKDAVIDVNGKMQVSILQGKVYIKETTCPLKSCQKQGVLSGIPIVCAPFDVVIFYSDSKDYDAYVR